MVTSTASPRSPVVLRSHGLSDPGLVRESNEDCFVIAELARALHVHQANVPHPPWTVGSRRGHLLLVADGVGGNQAGEIASGLTVRAVEAFLLNALRRFTNLKPDDEKGVLHDLQAALSRADAQLFAEAADHPEWSGMGTTLTLAFVADWRMHVAHVGDSRCYVFTDGQLCQVTRDHTMLAELVRHGVLTPEAQAKHPWRHVVTNLLGGPEPGVRVELHSLDLHPDDVILLCSDGLTEMVPDDVIADVLRGKPDPRLACERLIAEANARGGRDNVTVIVAHIGQLAQEGR